VFDPVCRIPIDTCGHLHQLLDQRYPRRTGDDDVGFYTPSSPSNLDARPLCAELDPDYIGKLVDAAHVGLRVLYAWPKFRRGLALHSYIRLRR
jgi:hypothetical protein